MMNNISKSEKYSDGDYKFIKLSNGDSEFNRITCESDSICIIPFDTNNGKIKNLYLSRYIDYMTGDEAYTCINSNIKNDASTIYETLDDFISKDTTFDDR